MTLTDLGVLADLGRRAVALAARGRAAVPVRERRVRVLDALTLGPGNRLAVVRFGERTLLLAVNKGTIALIAEDFAS